MFGRWHSRLAHAPLGHADAMQIILFCMAPFLAFKLSDIYWTFGAPEEIRTPDPQKNKAESFAGKFGAPDDWWQLFEVPQRPKTASKRL
jgi:hypothetical protein